MLLVYKEIIMNKKLVSKFYKLSKVLYDARKKHSYTLKELSYFSGVSSSLISTLENCKTSSIPTQKTLVGLECALDIRGEELQRLFGYLPEKSFYSDKVAEVFKKLGNQWIVDISKILKSLKLSDETIEDILNIIELKIFQDIDEPWDNASFKVSQEKMLDLIFSSKNNPNSPLKALFSMFLQE